MKILRGGLSIMLLLLIVCVSSSFAQVSPTDRWNVLRSANSLESEGKLPFHLVMSFQLYDMAGRPAEVGTVEQWWSSAHKVRTSIHSPSFNLGDGEETHHDVSSARESYLVNELLSVAISPVPLQRFAGSSSIDEEKRSFGKTTLNCLAPKSSPPPGMIAVQTMTVCTDLDLDAARILIHNDAGEVISRNSMKKFHDTFVSFDLQISFAGHNAIAGKVTTLEKFEPEPVVSDLQPVDSQNKEGMVKASGGVLTGKLVKNVPPTYPSAAKERHIGGIVFLHAVIGKNGNVTNVVPIASSDPVLTPAAVEAVRQWEYSPYLLNGQPTEVDTTITVHFNLNHN